MTIAFGSCNHVNDPQPLWNKIAKAKPDLWIWTGDIIYGDTEDMSVLQGKYKKQLSNPEYNEFMTMVVIMLVPNMHKKTPVR